MLTNCIGAPDENLEERELRIAELEDKIEMLEKDNFRIRQEATSGGGNKQGGFKTKEENDKIINDLSK